ncbi:hypothetical protein [Mycobacteroides abscessus]|uniref:hypothetical protein n=1 Tax=Mycobacteroides abscessus TaxID=36809 RepID=UPI0009298C69|nr:hypothetical protein [Mycobacteroides abscessus]SII67291.1 Uncharacterised protein [Mycobacteroides abscessus subsp. abscessus]SIK85601.1 Uncharacterised protein [Mycobacteroides abscessus subsp. abscessus]
MDDWTVRIAVAAIAALGVVVAAFIGLIKDRKNRREIILQDLQILDHLGDPSANREALGLYIDKRILMLAVEDKLSLIFYRLATVVAVVVLSIASGVIGYLTQHVVASLAIAIPSLVILGIIVFIYQYVKAELPDQLKKSVEKSVRAKFKEEHRDKWVAEIRERVLKATGDQIPEDKRSEVEKFLDAFIDDEIDGVLEQHINTHFEKLWTSFGKPPNKGSA